MSKKVTPQELRIGNWVKDRGGKTLRIDWFEKDKICSGGVFNGMPVHPFTEYFDYLQPIELTPEILESAGFENNTMGRYLRIDDKPYGFRTLSVSRNTDKDLSYWNAILTDFDGKNPIGTDCIFIRRDLKYVHELQNLIYSLTSHNLTIKF